MRELEAALASYPPDILFAVRSSATAEDLPDASFAGQQDSYLNVGAADVPRAVLDCYASLYNDRAVAYRRKNGYRHEDVAIAVVVQEMVPSQVSGVLFTADPMTSDRLTCVIEAVVGLGAMIGTGDQSALVRLFFEMAGKIPAIWAFGGISMLLFGALPRWMSGLSYGLMVLFVLLEILWEQQSVSDAVYALSPFSWVTPLKVAQPPSVLVLLCALSALLAVLGIVLFERRDAAMH